MGDEILAILIVFIVFSVPLSAIVLNSAVGKAIARYIDRKAKDATSDVQLIEIKKLQQELIEQRNLIYTLQEENQKLEEKYSFLERLLEAPKK